MAGKIMSDDMDRSENDVVAGSILLAWTAVLT
jgi:hypothetical protein